MGLIRRFRLLLLLIICVAPIAYYHFLVGIPDDISRVGKYFISIDNALKSKNAELVFPEYRLWENADGKTKDTALFDEYWSVYFKHTYNIRTLQKSHKGQDPERYLRSLDVSKSDKEKIIKVIKIVTIQRDFF